MIFLHNIVYVIMLEGGGWKKYRISTIYVGKHNLTNIKI